MIELVYGFVYSAISVIIWAIIESSQALPMLSPAESFICSFLVIPAMWLMGSMFKILID